MKSLLPIVILTFKEGLRSRLLIGVTFAAIFFMGCAVMISGLFMRDIQKVLLDLCLAAVSIGGLLIPFFTAVQCLSGDIENRTIYTILSQPISRHNYILGRFIGLFLLTTAVIAILTIATFFFSHSAKILYPPRFFSTFSHGAILFSCFTTLLGIALLNAVVLLWCSITTSSFLATLLTLSTYIVGHSVEKLLRFIQSQEAILNIPLYSKATIKIILYIFPNLSAFDYKQSASHGLQVKYIEVVYLLGYSISYSMAILLLTILFFNKRDIK